MVEYNLPIHYVTREIHSSHFVYKEDNIMENEKESVMTKFSNSVSDLCRLIDLKIDEKDYTSARCLVSDMETFLKKIVTAML